MPEGRVRRPIKASAIIALGPVPAIPVLSLSLSLLFRLRKIPIVGSHKYSRGIRYTVARVNEPTQAFMQRPSTVSMRSRFLHSFCGFCPILPRGGLYPSCFTDDHTEILFKQRYSARFRESL